MQLIAHMGRRIGTMPLIRQPYGLPPSPQGEGLEHKNHPRWMRRHLPGVLKLIGHVNIQVHIAFDAGDLALVGVLPHFHLVGVGHTVLIQGQPEGVILQLA